jgi:hypothetical protein
MRFLLITLLMVSGLSAHANLGKDLSTLVCSDKYRAKSEAKLFPQDGKPSFFLKASTVIRTIGSQQIKNF